MGIVESLGLGILLLLISGASRVTFGYYLSVIQADRCPVWQLPLRCLFLALQMMCGVGLLTVWLANYTDAVYGGGDSQAHWALSVLVAPVLETVLLQVIPVYIGSKFAAPGAWQLPFFVSWGAFLGLHLLRLGVAGLPVGLVAGSALAMIYLVVLPARGRAFGVTALTHILYNTIAYLLAII